ncbi:MAG TPA: tetratricopeptide repeat protein, partial [Candidatus Angelobacter sp.]
WAERAVRAVASAFPNVKYETWSECARLLPHARVCVELIEQWKMTFAEAARLLNQTGWYLRERVQYAEAEPLIQRALKMNEQVLGLEDAAVAYSLNNLAELYRVQGKYEQAEPLFQRASAVYEKVLVH